VDRDRLFVLTFWALGLAFMVTVLIIGILRG
jgi:hypothetical protein